MASQESWVHCVYFELQTHCNHKFRMFWREIFFRFINNNCFFLLNIHIACRSSSNPIGSGTQSSRATNIFKYLCGPILRSVSLVQLKSQNSNFLPFLCHRLEVLSIFRNNKFGYQRYTTFNWSWNTMNPSQWSAQFDRSSSLADQLLTWILLKTLLANFLLAYKPLINSKKNITKLLFYLLNMSFDTLKLNWSPKSKFNNPLI